jgi:ATP sulfurylase
MEFYYCKTCKEMKSEIKCEKKCELYTIEINDKLLEKRIVTASEIGKADVRGVIRKYKV